MGVSGKLPAYGTPLVHVASSAGHPPSAPPHAEQMQGCQRKEPGVKKPRPQSLLGERVTRAGVWVVPLRRPEPTA